MTWYWININYATFGIAVDDNGKCIIAAPIGKWMIGKNIIYIRNWVNKKKGVCEILP